MGINCFTYADSRREEEEEKSAEPSHRKSNLERNASRGPPRLKAFPSRERYERVIVIIDL